MRRQSLFWGSVLILLSALFLLKAFNVIDNVLDYFWALGLMLAGVWILLSAFIHRDVSEDGEGATIGLQGAKEARIEFHHGVGRIEIGAGAPANLLLVANKGAGMSVSSQLDGEKLKAKVDSGPTFVPFIGPESGAWNFRLNAEIPLALNVEAGASQVTLNLTDLRVTRLNLKTGASGVKINLPAHVANTLVDIEAGATSLDISVPSGVAARVRVKEGVSSLQIDSNRFPRLDNTLYQSSDYDNASNRVELNIEAGVGSINIH